MTDEYLTPREAARRLGVTAKTLREWANDGLVEFHLTAGKHRRYLASSVEALANGAGS